MRDPMAAIHSFLLSETSYAGFIFGMVFFFLAAISIVLLLRRNRSLDWCLLALFSFTYGACHLLSFFSLGFYQSQNIGQPVTDLLSLISLLLLAEFGRKSLSLMRARSIPWWIFIPLAFIVLFPAALGKWNLARIILDDIVFPFSGIIAGAAFFLSARKNKSHGSIALLISGICIFLYCLLRGFLASHFYSSGIAPERLESISLSYWLGIISIIFCSALFSYSRSAQTEKLALDSLGGQYGEDYWILLLLIFTLGTGGIIASLRGEKTRQEVNRDAMTDAQAVAHHLNASMQSAQQAVQILSYVPAIVAALQNNTSASIQRAAQALTRTNRILNASFIYLLDKSGKVIAVAEGPKSGSILGQNYGFRPYFKESLQGKTGSYFAVGVTTQERGYYASAPVKDKNGLIMGVIALKIQIEDIEHITSPRGFMFIIDPQGVIFLSNRADLLFRSLWPLASDHERQITAGRQFGIHPIHPILDREIHDGQDVLFESGNHLVRRIPIAMSGWSVVLISSLRSVELHQFLVILATLFFAALLLSAYIILNQNREAARRVLASERNFRGLVFTSVDALVSIDGEGRITLWNPAAETTFGYSSAEMIGQSIMRVIPDRHQSEFREKLNQLAQESHPPRSGITIETELLSHDGTEVPVEYTMSLLQSDHGKIATAIIRDITSRKEAEQKLAKYAEELKESSEDVRRFTYIVSHDLRGPLVNIRGFAEELRGSMEMITARITDCVERMDEAGRLQMRALMEEEIPEALDYIDTSVTRMDGLINAILRLSRLGHREMVFEPVDMNELAKSILQSLTHQAEKKNAIVQIDPLPGVMADKTAMEQIIGNLLSNAVAYLEPGRPGRIHISGEKQAMETLFRVEDNGRGIESKDLIRVFDLFVRVGLPDTPGEGMGLAYVKALVRRHGGRIWCESIFGQGTTFYFTILNDLDKISLDK